jgi:hypothetical protein
MDKKGNWNVYDPIDLDSPSILDIIDPKMAKNVADDIRKQLEQANLKPHKPILAPNKNPQYSKLIQGDAKKSPTINKDWSSGMLAPPKAPMRA